MRLVAIHLRTLLIWCNVPLDTSENLDQSNKLVNDASCNISLDTSENRDQSNKPVNDASCNVSLDTSENRDQSNKPVDDASCNVSPPPLPCSSEEATTYHPTANQEAITHKEIKKDTLISYKNRGQWKKGKVVSRAGKVGSKKGKKWKI